MSRPLLSVVVPTHGRTELLAETIRCLVSQTYENFELMVSDDSPLQQDRESVAGLVEEYARSTGRASEYIFSSPSLGQAGNTNQGIAACSGIYIRILHSDDLLAPVTLQREVDVLRQLAGAVRAVFHHPLVFEEAAAWGEPTTCVVEPATYIRDRLPLGTPPPSCTLLHRSLFDAVGGFDDRYKMMQDWDLVARVLLHEHEHRRFVAMFTPGLVGWRWHSDSVTGHGWVDHFRDHARLTQSLLAGTRGDTRLWATGSRREFAALSIRFRMTRLFSDLAQLRQQAPLTLAHRRELMSLILLPASLRQLIPLMMRVATGVPGRFWRWDHPPDAAQAPTEGHDVEIVSSAQLHPHPRSPMARVCVTFTGQSSLEDVASYWKKAARVTISWPATLPLREEALQSLLAAVPAGAEARITNLSAEHAHRISLAASRAWRAAPLPVHELPRGEGVLVVRPPDTGASAMTGEVCSGTMGRS